jgi:hypothetical protein
MTNELQGDVGDEQLRDEWIRLIEGPVTGDVRDEVIAEFARQLSYRDVDAEVCCILLQAYNAMHCQPPLDERDVRTLTQIYASGAHSRRSWSPLPSKAPE